MYVLHVYRTYFPDPPGGLQEAIRQIALATRSQGSGNTVFTLTPTPEQSIVLRPEATVMRCRSWGAPASCDIGGIGAFSTFGRLAKAAEVVQYHFPWPFGDLLHLAARPKAPAILTWHSDIVRQSWLRRAYAPLMRRTLDSVRVVVATSEAYAASSPVLSHPSVRDKVRVVPLGIDEASYPAEGDDTILARLGLDEGEPFFLFLGVLRYYKGITFLVDAARRLGVKVVIAGDGSMREKFAASAQGAENIVFAGRVTDREKVSLFKACRALVLPSHLRAEAFGMVLVEAAMFGKPMISCEIGTGTSYVNAHGETGLVVRPASADALAEAMHALWRDDGMAIRMGRAARARYERLFSGAMLGRAYDNLYREMLS